VDGAFYVTPAGLDANVARGPWGVPGFADRDRVQPRRHPILEPRIGGEAIRRIACNDDRIPAGCSADDHRGSRRCGSAGRRVDDVDNKRSAGDQRAFFAAPVAGDSERRRPESDREPNDANALVPPGHFLEKRPTDAGTFRFN
jgi:hypothetical protein